MELIYDWEAQGQRPGQKPKIVFSIGVFDGLHRGHQHLINMVSKSAAQLNAQSLVLTFDPHPLEILAKEAAPPTLTTVAQKVDILSGWGVDCLGVLKFSREMANMEPMVFLQQFLEKFIEPVGVIIGPDFSFGRGASGGAETICQWLREITPKAQVTIVEPVAGENGEFSSSQIRQDLKDGLINSVTKALGRTYRLSGVVVHGQARGRTLGFPTANLGEVPQLIPAPGVYATKVNFNGQIYGSMTSIGYNPTFGEQPMTVETYIFDFDAFIYGETLDVDFIARLRDMVKFKSIEQLAAQLHTDQNDAKQVLSGLK